MNYVNTIQLAKRLEQMCATLAETIELQTKWYNTRGDMPRKLDEALSWRDNDRLVDAKVDHALAEYVEMTRELKGE